MVGGIALGVFATAANLYYVGACIAAAVLVIVVGRQFEAALLAYILVAFVPWGKTPDLAVGGSGAGKGIYVSEVMVGFLLVVWWGKYLLSALPKNRPGSGFHLPILLYLGYSVLNVVHSFVFWDFHVNRMYQFPHVNAIEVGFRVLSAGAFAMAATSITSARWLRWATLAILTPGLYNLLNALANHPVPVSAPWWPLITLLSVSYCWAIVLDLRRSRGMRLLCGAVVAAAVYVVMFRGIMWVSGWLGLLAALGTVTLLRSRRAFAMGLALALATMMAFWPYFHANVVTASVEEGDYDRFALLAGAWKYATNFPLGVGLGNYRTYNSFHYGEKWGTTSYTSAHGTYAQHLSEMGIPGTLLLLAVLVGGFRWMLVRYRELPDGPSRTYLIAAMGQIVGIACAANIGDYIVPTYHNGGLATFSATVYSWLAWGLAVAHVRISGTGDASGKPAAERSEAAYA